MRRLLLGLDVVAVCGRPDDLDRLATLMAFVAFEKLGTFQHVKRVVSGVFLMAVGREYGGYARGQSEPPPTR